MELLVILYLAYAHLVHPQEARHHYPLQLERTALPVQLRQRPIQDANGTRGDKVEDFKNSEKVCGTVPSRGAEGF